MQAQAETIVPAASAMPPTNAREFMQTSSLFPDTHVPRRRGESPSAKKPKLLDNALGQSMVE
jgi:hypothetical protein